MRKLEVHPGQRYGRLVVVEEVSRNRFGRRQFRFKCDCGSETVTSWRRWKSCGCLQRDTAAVTNRLKKSLVSGESAFNSLYCRTRISARVRNLDFDLSKTDFRRLIKEPCHYCGQTPSQIFGVRSRNGSFVYNGLDRFDNFIGYTLGNVVPCCKTCNYAKRNMSVDEFLAWVKQVALHNALIALW